MLLYVESAESFPACNNVLACCSDCWVMLCSVQMFVVPFVISSYIEMADLKEQHVCIKFLFELGKMLWKPSKCWLYVSESREWEEHNFLNDHPFKVQSCVISVEYAEQLGRPLTSKTDENVDWVKEVFHKQMNHYSWSWWHVVNFIWINSEHYDGQSKHASDCCHIRASPAEWIREGKPYWHMPRHSWEAEKDSEFFRCGFMCMTKKPSNHFSGRAYHLRGT